MYLPRIFGCSRELLCPVIDCHPAAAANILLTPPPPKKIYRRAAAASQNHPARRRRNTDVGAGLYPAAAIRGRLFTQYCDLRRQNSTDVSTVRRFICSFSRAKYSCIPRRRCLVVRDTTS